MQSSAPFSIDDALAQENDVSCLGVCEYFAPEKIGVGVLQAAGSRQKTCCCQCFRHLSV